MSKKNNALKQSMRRIRKRRISKNQAEALSDFDHAWDQLQTMCTKPGKKNRVSPMDDAELAEMTERIFLEQMVLESARRLGLKFAVIVLDMAVLAIAKESGAVELPKEPDSSTKPN
jgi:hypothetical protein